MIPNIFISSTINDLSHLRDSIRDLIFEIGYNPIMSEYGDIGYLPSNSAEDSCYIALKDCQFAIMIIGKRYGSLSKNGLSVTHNEFKTTRERKIPVIFLISEEVMSFKKVYDVNKTKENLEFPGMENPNNIFQFINEFSESETNNGIVFYTNVQSAKTNLKKQLAHIVGDLFRKQFDPVKGEIKDILSEITTLRHILLKSEQEVARKFSTAFRFLLNEENEYLKDITETISGSLEEGVPELIKSISFNKFLENNDVKIEILESIENLDIKSSREFIKNNSAIKKICYSELPYISWKNRANLGSEPDYNIVPENPNDNNVVFAFGEKILIANKNAIKLLEVIFDTLITRIN